MPALGTEQLLFGERVKPRNEEEEKDVGFFTAEPDAIATVGKATICRSLFAPGANLRVSGAM